MAGVKPAILKSWRHRGYGSVRWIQGNLRVTFFPRTRPIMTDHRRSWLIECPNVFGCLLPAPTAWSADFETQRPTFILTLTIARLGSTKTVDSPNVGLNRLSVASASSAVLFSTLSTSRSNSIRPRRPFNIVLDARTSSNDWAGSRREPRGSRRMRWSPWGSEICALAAHGLPLKY